MDITPKITECEEYRLLNAHLEDSTADLNVTLSQLINPLTQALEKASPSYSVSDGDLETYLCKVWHSILALASNTPHDSPRQAELTKLMTKLVQQIPLEAPDQNVVEIQGLKVWTDLPLFGQETRESWNFPKGKEVESETKDKWINVNAFVARLTAAFWAVESGQYKVDTWANPKALDFSLYGIWALRDGLEEEVKTGSTGDALIGAAAVWILYAGSALKSQAEKGKEFRGRMARAGGKVKDKEWRGYTVGRWQLWKDEFANARSLAESQEVRSLVTKALEMMKQ